MSVDISNFFGSVHQAKIINVFLEAGYPSHVAFLLARLCSFCNSLPQGGASSPQLSNVIMYDFDERIAAYAAARGLTYTRYVDDITLSGERTSPADLWETQISLETLGLSLNRKKIRFQRGRRKVITGISIGTGKLRLPRAMRRRFRNEAFFALKDASHPMDARRILDDPTAFDRTLGRLAYWRNVEPSNTVVHAMDAELRARSDPASDSPKS